MRNIKVSDQTPKFPEPPFERAQKRSEYECPIDVENSAHLRFTTLEVLLRCWHPSHTAHHRKLMPSTEEEARDTNRSVAAP